MKALRVAAVALLAAALLTISVAVAAPDCDTHPGNSRWCRDTTTTSTTTTTQGTTTTTTAATTTTTAPGLVIPPTESYPARGSGIPYADGGGFDIIARNAEAGIVWWTAAYWGDNGLPYTDGATWLPGDREGYRCGYGFITDSSGWDIHGRFAFVRPPDALYAAVNDQYMEEGVRYLDGTLANEGQEIGSEDCTDVLSPVDYEGACRPVDERPRVAFFDSAGDVLDIRDYTNTVANNVVFNLHSVTEDRVTVIACEDGLVGMIVYYDSMGDGQVAAELDGATVTP
jgi:hypothetical protein